jgi:formamidopyrimidine-DNA glycosylase
MPELPDVESFRRRIQESALDRTIAHVRFRDADEVLDTSESTIRRHLLDHQFSTTHRHGKHLFARVDDEGWLMLHFGMTGDVFIGAEDDTEPEYTKMRLDFDDRGFLAYVNMRKLGHIDWTDDVDDYVEEQDLGPDALEIDWETFRGRVGGRRGMLKTALMDQSVMAGLGNVYSDELLFQTGFHPEHEVQELDESELRSLFDTMKRILPIITDAFPNLEELPGEYLVAHRDEEDECPRCGGPIRREKVGGRSAYFCPDCQE